MEGQVRLGSQNSMEWIDFRQRVLINCYLWRVTWKPREVVRSEGNKKLSLSGLGRTRSLRLEVESKRNRKPRRRSRLVWPSSPVVQFRMYCT